MPETVSGVDSEGNSDRTSEVSSRFEAGSDWISEMMSGSISVVSFPPSD